LEITILPRECSKQNRIACLRREYSQVLLFYHHPIVVNARHSSGLVIGHRGMTPDIRRENIVQANLMTDSRSIREERVQPLAINPRPQTDSVRVTIAPQYQWH